VERSPTMNRPRSRRNATTWLSGRLDRMSGYTQHMGRRSLKQLKSSRQARRSASSRSGIGLINLADNNGTGQSAIVSIGSAASSPTNDCCGRPSVVPHKLDWEVRVLVSHCRRHGEPLLATLKKGYSGHRAYLVIASSTFAVSVCMWKVCSLLARTVQIFAKSAVVDLPVAL
jgi:hypothetical protein